MVPPPLLRQTGFQPDELGQIVHVNGQSVIDNIELDRMARISRWLEDLLANNDNDDGEETEREDIDSSGSEDEVDDDVVLVG